MSILSFVLALGLAGAPQQPNCLPPGWKEGDPIVFSDQAPCLRDQEVRTQTEARALAGDMAAASLLADYYMGGAGDDKQEAIRWLRVYAKAGGSEPIILAQLLLDSPSLVERNEGASILEQRARAGDDVAARLLGEERKSSGDAIGAASWYEASAMHGNVDAMILLSELLLSRDDDASAVLGAMWALVAAQHFAGGTFMHGQLQENATRALQKASVDSAPITAVAKQLANVIKRKQRAPASSR